MSGRRPPFSSHTDWPVTGSSIFLFPPHRVFFLFRFPSVLFSSLISKPGFHFFFPVASFFFPIIFGRRSWIRWLCVTWVCFDFSASLD